jgi:hypothetical protein
MASSFQPFCAFQDVTSRHAVIAVDIGYSSKRKTCGLACDEQIVPRSLCFGECVTEVAELCRKLEDPILVIEAPLSTRHQENGNPAMRGRFEKAREWYRGPGAMTLLAAMRFLKEVGNRLPAGRPIFLAEAFLSKKKTKSRHEDDARRIVDEFWRREIETLYEGVEPAVDLISGVPCVRVFPTE